MQFFLSLVGSIIAAVGVLVGSALLLGERNPAKAIEFDGFTRYVWAETTFCKDPGDAQRVVNMLDQGLMINQALIHINGLTPQDPLCIFRQAYFQPGEVVSTRIAKNIVWEVRQVRIIAGDKTLISYALRMADFYYI